VEVLSKEYGNNKLKGSDRMSDYVSELIRYTENIPEVPTKKNMVFSIWNEFCSKFKTWVDFDRRGSDISTKANIDESVVFYHKGIGVIIGSGVRIGKNCKIYQNVTIGSRGKHGFPVVGDFVVIGAYSCILGDITLGDWSVIGAGSLVLKDVPSATIVKGVWK